MATVRQIGILPRCVPVGRPTNWPLAEPPLVGPGTEFPIAFTKEQIMWLYWRVKRLTLFASDSSYFQTKAIFPELENTSTAFNEKELVCSQFTFSRQYEVSESIYTSTNPDRLQLWSAQLDINWNLLFTDGNGAYFLDIRIDFETADSSILYDGDTAIEVVYDNLSSLTSTYRLNDGTINPSYTESGTCSFCGIDVQLGLFQRGGGEFFAAGSVVASEFYPYDPGDGGGPIYDTVTGAQLRDFPV